MSVRALIGLAEVAQQYGDGLVRVTGRANLQLRALPLVDGALPADVVAAIETTGLLPSRSHDLVRNILVSPQTGLSGGLADVRPAARELDRRLLTDSRLSDLPGRFLFTLDDGRGDLHDRHLDLGLVALDDNLCQLRVGGVPSVVLPLADSPTALTRLARRFLAHRGTGRDAAWHVNELPHPLSGATADLTGGVCSPPLPYGRVPGGLHLDAHGGLARDLIAAWAATDHVVLTPWHGVLIPKATA